MNRRIFWYFHMKRTFAWIGRVSSIGTSGNQMGQSEEYNKCSKIFHFQIRFENLCDMRSSIVMLENYFVMSLFVLWPFLLRCSAQTHQLKSIPISCNGFVRLEQLVIHDTLLIPPNTEHNLGAMDIRLCRGCWCMARLTPWFFLPWIVVPTFYQQ